MLEYARPDAGSLDPRKGLPLRKLSRRDSDRRCDASATRRVVHRDLKPSNIIVSELRSSCWISAWQSWSSRTRRARPGAAPNVARCDLGTLST